MQRAIFRVYILGLFQSIAGIAVVNRHEANETAKADALVQFFLHRNNRFTIGVAIRGGNRDSIRARGLCDGLGTGSQQAFRGAQASKMRVDGLEFGLKLREPLRLLRVEGMTGISGLLYKLIEFSGFSAARSFVLFNLVLNVHWFGLLGLE
jgi:hypothetical protein